MDSNGLKKEYGEAEEVAELDEVDKDTPLQTESDTVLYKEDAAERSRRINVAYAMRYYFEQNRLRDQIRFGDGWVHRNKRRS